MKIESPSSETNNAKPYYSCRYLEGGLSFAYNQVKACAIRHHGRGAPMLAKYRGGEIDLDELIKEKKKIISENQREGHYSCKGCPELRKQEWPANKYDLNWIGITHYVVCNVHCNYCWLQWADWSPRNRKKHPPAQHYNLADLLGNLIDENKVDPNSIIDWGGGGEPTLMAEFDELFVKFSNMGAKQWLHTNAVRMPKLIRKSDISLSNVNVMCSVDCGTPETYVKIKEKDVFLQVCENLRRYKELGAHIVLKYLMIEENANDRDIEKFVKFASSIEKSVILSDIDYRHPDPNEQVIYGLRKLHATAEENGVKIKYGSTGGRSATEFNVKQKITDEGTTDHQEHNKKFKNPTFSIAYENAGKRR